MHVSVSVTEVASITRLICEPKNPELPENVFNTSHTKGLVLERLFFEDLSWGEG